MKNEEMNLLELINRAKGDRNMSQFAEDCGISPATMYKIAQGNFRKRISESTVDAIVANADPDSGVTKNDIITAEGFILDHMDPFAASRRAQQRMHKIREYEKKFSYLVPGYLMAKGYEVRPYVAESSVQERPGDFSFWVRCDDNEEIWSFDVIYAPHDRMHRGIFLERFYSRIGRYACNMPPDERPCRLFVVAIDDGDADPVDNEWDVLRVTLEKMRPCIDLCVLLVDTDLNFIREIFPAGNKKKSIFV